ncbi:RING finger and transmembrane domain-containing protein 2-like isoform X2 [Olea europaea var. sylvestris]|uniref:RING finger and transmembrane domain-containing 2-like n=1 Tax=Olea europaea subsp. europaea TaxID=158383 RepID=A0A8S0PL43_OLEEU|nr:RING finger and transmembrane domain-containing protein 2-like isoform X2 [Olea europaea var. sylvestris]CAA2954846.1 RING finger and transmembrane domain-containing 2-like [Olea europaea subsp. europaea]
METSSGVSPDSSNEDSLPSSPSNGGNSRIQFPFLRFFRSPISTLLEHTGILRVRPDHPYSEAHPLISENTNNNVQIPNDLSSINSNDITDSGNSSNNNGEVSIRIIGAGEQDGVRVVGNGDENDQSGSGLGLGMEESALGTDDFNGNGTTTNSNENNGNTSSYQRYDIQQVARWIEQILPFSLLLLVVFIRQHLQGFFATIWITAILFKSNDIVRKQTALKGERKIPVLVGYSVVFMVHVFGIYWWNRKDDLFHSLFMVPPETVPPFWHAIFIILVNDTMVRQVAMILKLVLLIYYKNCRGHNFRRQGQMLTLVEYTLLLYRALLPTPVWYRFFLNKDYGSLFSSLTTGLYLTFKLTSIVEKVQSFFASLKALSRKEIHYGSYATSEQVTAAGDLCAICQEKMHIPILLRCKHIFCEDCVSEWFERERTCPLCRALVRPADLRSYGDGSTSLFFQLF